MKAYFVSIDGGIKAIEGVEFHGSYVVMPPPDKTWYFARTRGEAFFKTWRGAQSWLVKKSTERIKELKTKIVRAEEDYNWVMFEYKTAIEHEEEKLAAVMNLKKPEE